MASCARQSGSIPGERQFLADCECFRGSISRPCKLDKQKLENRGTGRDGRWLIMIPSTRQRLWSTRWFPPGRGRLEAIVKRPGCGRAHIAPNALWWIPDPRGDPNAAMVLADLHAGASAAARSPQGINRKAWRRRNIKQLICGPYESSQPDFTVVFLRKTRAVFIINGKKV